MFSRAMLTRLALLSASILDALSAFRKMYTGVDHAHGDRLWATVVAPGARTQNTAAGMPITAALRPSAPSVEVLAENIA